MVVSKCRHNCCANPPLGVTVAHSGLRGLGSAVGEKWTTGWDQSAGNCNELRVIAPKSTEMQTTKRCVLSPVDRHVSGGAILSTPAAKNGETGRAMEPESC